jgi:hypothetical protein
MADKFRAILEGKDDIVLIINLSIKRIDAGHDMLIVESKRDVPLVKYNGDNCHAYLMNSNAR